MKTKGRPQSTHIVDMREGTSRLEKMIGKSLTYQNYQSVVRSKTPTNKTGNDSMPRRSEKAKRNNRQR